MALHLARPKQRLHSNPSLIHLFSTSSSSSSQDGNESSEHPSQSPSSTSSSPSDFKTPSYFSGIKSSLKQTQAQDGRRQFVRFDANAQNPSPSLSGNQIGGRTQDIRRNLNEFRSRAAAPPPRDFQDSYKQNVLSKSGDSFGTRKIEGTPFANIKENLRQMRPQANTESKWANLSGLQNTMKTKFNENLRSNVIGGGGEGLPYSVFGKELEEGKKNENETEEMKSEFIKSYDPIELGEKLRLYRPQAMKEEGWFSLQELNQRLVKLRAMEEEHAQRSRIAHPSMVKELRSEIQKAKAAEALKSVACRFRGPFITLSLCVCACVYF